MKEMSHRLVPGPNKILRPELPKRGFPFARLSARASVVKQLVLNHCSTVRGPAPLHTRSGRGEAEPLLEKSSAEYTVQGRPLWKVRIPVNSHPPAKALTKPLRLRNCRPLPKGNCQMGLITSC